MVAPIAWGDTNQWSVMEWVWSQGKHLPSGSHTAVLAYLASKAFYTTKNPENGDIGQVMRASSYAEVIMEATGIRSRSTLRKILNDLQDMAFIQREEREGEKVYGQKPHMMYVLWEMEDLRAQIRDGKKALPPPLRLRPTASPRKPRALAEVVEIPVSINS